MDGSTELNYINPDLSLVKNLENERSIIESVPENSSSNDDADQRTEEIIENFDQKTEV